MKNAVTDAETLSNLLLVRSINGESSQPAKKVAPKVFLSATVLGATNHMVTIALT